MVPAHFFPSKFMVFKSEKSLVDSNKSALVPWTIVDLRELRKVKNSDIVVSNDFFFACMKDYTKI